jgi:hypothetical protein
MLTWQFEIVVVFAAYFLGWFEGPRVWNAVKVLAGKEIVFVESKIHPTTTTGTTGATGAH